MQKINIYTCIHMHVYTYSYALQNLYKREDIIITKADKGGAAVIVDVADYVQEANRQLDNKEFYKKTTTDTTEINQIKVNGTINELKSSHLFNENVADDLLRLKAKKPQFKCFPKFTKRETLVDQ